MGENTSDFKKCDSMKKPWLVLIMREKYGKQWKEGGRVSL